MKAWLVKDKEESYATVVFAETRGKAKSLALATECCEDSNFCDVEVRRLPQLDKYYVPGKKELDWLDPKDRIALVKDAGFYCDSEYFDPDECKICSASRYCDRYADHIKEEDGKI